MPIREYLCKNGHLTEQIMLLSNNPSFIDCPSCDTIAEKIWSSPANIQIAKPTRIFVNPKTGETIMALTQYQRAPAGFVDKELKGPIERSKFEKAEQVKTDIINQAMTLERQEKLDATTNLRHKELEASMSKICAESDNPAATERILRKAMNRSKQKRIKPRKSNVQLAVNHQDKSNLQDTVK